MKKRTVIGFVGLAIVLVLLFSFLTYLQKPSSFTVVSSPTPILATPDTTWGVYNGKHFSIEYPNSVTVYSKQDQDVINNPSLQEFWRISQDDPRMVFVVEVVTKPDLLNINEFSAVQLRRNESDSYTESSIKAAGLSGLQFVKHGGMGGVYSEQGAFFMVGHSVYSFVLTAVDESQAKPVFDRMINSLRDLH
jgi:hypothetical protein